MSSPEPVRSLGAATPRVPEPHGREDAVRIEPAIVARIRAGDQVAFEQLFRRYFNPLCVFVRRYVGDAQLAEELVQTVFARLWERRGEWIVRSSLAGYLYAAARYEVLDYRRDAAVAGRAVERSLGQNLSPGQSQQPPEPDALCEAAELSVAVREAIERLPERCRLIFTLRWQHHLSYAEIAETLDIATKTVETQLNRALKALREPLRPYL